MSNFAVYLRGDKNKSKLRQKNKDAQSTETWTEKISLKYNPTFSLYLMSALWICTATSIRESTDLGTKLGAGFVADTLANIAANVA